MSPHERVDHENIEAGTEKRKTSGNPDSAYGDPKQS